MRLTQSPIGAHWCPCGRIAVGQRRQSVPVACAPSDPWSRAWCGRLWQPKHALSLCSGPIRISKPKSGWTVGSVGRVNGA